jgi:hypothetical protein
MDPRCSEKHERARDEAKSLLAEKRPPKADERIVDMALLPPMTSDPLSRQAVLTKGQAVYLIGSPGSRDRGRDGQHPESRDRRTRPAPSRRPSRRHQKVREETQR